MGDDTRDDGNDFLDKLAAAKEVRLETERDRLEEIKATYREGNWYNVVHQLEWLIAEVERLRTALEAVLDNYHHDHRGCGGVVGAQPGDSDYCSIRDAFAALASVETPDGT